MRLPTPSPGAVIGTLALIVALGGTADAVAKKTVPEAKPPVTLNAKAFTFTVPKPCTALIGSEVKTFAIAHAGFFTVDVDSAVSTTATVTLNGSGSFAGPSVRWRVDNTSVGGASTVPMPRKSHITFNPGSEVTSTPLWLKAGEHNLEVSYFPYAKINNKVRCGSYRTSFSQLHARLIADR